MGAHNCGKHRGHKRNCADIPDKDQEIHKEKKGEIGKACFFGICHAPLNYINWCGIYSSEMQGFRTLLVCVLLALALSGAYAEHLLMGVKASCWKQVIRPDESVDANIVIENDSNTAFQDVNVFWYVEDPSGKIISSGALYLDFREKGI